MIRRSEKRRLIGIEALGEKAAELGLASYTICPHAVSLVQFPRQHNTYLGYFVGRETVLPLLNPF